MEEKVDVGTVLDDESIRKLEEEEKRAHDQNKRDEFMRQKKLAAKRKRTPKETTAEKVRELDELLAKSAVSFIKINSPVMCN